MNDAALAREQRRKLAEQVSTGKFRSLACSTTLQDAYFSHIVSKPESERGAMKAWVALLRGINVGGKNAIPMSELKSSLSSLGLEDVVTYIQSGNVAFRAPGDAHTVADDIEQRIAEAFGVNVTVLLRTPAELRAVARSNPFLGDADLSKLHVVFLSGRPAVSAVAGLDPERSPPDEFSLLGSEIYLRLPNGAGRSKLTIDYFERRLGVAATARNWNTVIKLVALTER